MSAKLEERLANVRAAAKVDPMNYEILDAFIGYTDVALYNEKDIPKGLEIAEETKAYIDNFIYLQSNGGNFKWLEEIQQEQKKNYPIIDKYYALLKLCAPFDFDSFMLYIEKNRKRQARFYEPRRKTLHQVAKALQEIEDDKLDELFVHMPARVGKLISDDTPVFTARGWVNHGDLQVGDKVISDTGQFIKVVAVGSPFHSNKRVFLSNGEQIDCHSNHEWEVFDLSACRRRVMETHEIQDLLPLHKKNNFLIPKREALKGSAKYLKLHPYVLGVWLGQGESVKPRIVTDDEKLIDILAYYGYKAEKVKDSPIDKYYDFGNELKSRLNKYNLCYYSSPRAKRIPIEYLTSTKSNRLMLLAGILDSSGFAVPRNKEFRFVTQFEELEKDFVTLINTFGWKYSEEKETPGYPVKDYWVVKFFPEEYIPCKLTKNFMVDVNKAHDVYIVDIKDVEPKTGRCIQVDSYNGLYAVGKTMVLTHNSQIITLFTAWHCARDTEKSNLYVTYKEGLGGAFLDGVLEIITDPTYCFRDVFPHITIADTDAKNNKLDLDRKKKYKTLSAKGLESGLNGEYDAYGILICDDLLAGVEDVLSADVLKRKQTIFDNNVIARAKESCKKIFNGTIWATNDLFMDRINFLENDPSAEGIRYKVIIIPALDPETDESNFDYDYGVGFSTEHWRRRRAKFELNNDMAGWYAQCQQQPIDRTGAVFDPEGMRYYSFLPGVDPIKVITHVDVSLGGGDFLSMPVVYYFENGDGGLDGYVEDVIFDNSEKHITEPQVVSMIKKHHIKHVHFEANQGGEGYAEDIQRMIKEDKSYKTVCNISTDWAMVTKRKEQRIWDNAEEIRKLYFKDPAHRSLQYKKFMQNLFSFSMNQKRKAHDDAPDSLSGLIDFERTGTGVRKAKIIKSPI